MATLTIRDLDDDVRAQLRIRAAQHGRSMEAEVRSILRDAVMARPAAGRLGSRVHERFAAVGGADLDLPERSDAPRAADPPR
jgi:antitoxin FitA